MMRPHRRAHFWTWLIAFPVTLALLAAGLYARHAAARALAPSPAPTEPRP